MTKYLGVWYEMHRSNNTNSFETGDCVTADYSARQDGLIKVDNAELKKSGDKERSHVIAKAEIRDPKKDEGKFGVSFSVF